MHTFLELKEYPELVFLSFGVYHKLEKMLVIGDLHLGLEDSLMNTGIFLPYGNLKKIKQRILDMLAVCKDNKLKIEKILILGDLKHDFERLSLVTRKEIGELLISLKDKKIIFIKGNHDTYLPKFLEERGIEVKEKYELDRYLFIHGDKDEKSDKIIIIGHEHPSISIKKDNTVQRYKCFVLSKKLIVLPSINGISIGSDLKTNQILSPLLKNVEENNITKKYILVEDKYLFLFEKLE